MNFHLTLASRNRKTGFIPVATSSRRTCPDSCSLKSKGCYAESGPLRLHWDAVTQGRRGVSFDAFCKEVKRLPRHQLWRYGQAGDLLGTGDEIDGPALEKLARANARRPVIAYTHKPITSDNLTHLRKAQAKGFPVNLSADTLTDADRLANTGLPTVVILPTHFGRRKSGGAWAEDLSTYATRMASLLHQTPQGRKIAVCPAAFTEVTCSQCQVCASDRKGIIVGFPAHGPLASTPLANGLRKSAHDTPAHADRAAPVNVYAQCSAPTAGAS